MLKTVSSYPRRRFCFFLLITFIKPWSVISFSVLYVGWVDGVQEEELLPRFVPPEYSMASALRRNAFGLSYFNFNIKCSGCESRKVKNKEAVPDHKFQHEGEIWAWKSGHLILCRVDRVERICYKPALFSPLTLCGIREGCMSEVCIWVISSRQCKQDFPCLTSPSRRQVCDGPI